MDPEQTESAQGQAESPIQAETPAAPEAPKMVDVHVADRASLDEALAKAQADEAAAAESDSATTDASQSTEPQTPHGQPASAADVATQGAQPSKPATQDTIQGTDAETERLRLANKEKELFIQHRGNELGTLRGQLAAARQQLTQTKAQLEASLEEKFSTNPVEAANDRDEIKRISGELSNLEAQEERAVRIVEAQTFFLRHVDTAQVSPDDIAVMLREVDGLDEGAIAAYKQNPWEWTTPEALVQMGKRAFERKEFKTADSDRRILAKHVIKLNEEIAKLKARPGQVMSQVQRHLNQSPPVTAAAASGARPALDMSRIPEMSRDELNKAMQASMNNGN